MSRETIYSFIRYGLANPLAGPFHLNVFSS
jgi:hypothetical protein